MAAIRTPSALASASWRVRLRSRSTCSRLAADVRGLGGPGGSGGRRLRRAQGLDHGSGLAVHLGGHRGVAPVAAALAAEQRIVGAGDQLGGGHARLPLGHAGGARRARRPGRARRLEPAEPLERPPGRPRRPRARRRRPARSRTRRRRSGRPGRTGELPARSAWPTRRSTSSPARWPWRSLTGLEVVEVDQGEGEAARRRARSGRSRGAGPSCSAAWLRQPVRLSVRAARASPACSLALRRAHVGELGEGLEQEQLGLTGHIRAARSRRRGPRAGGRCS